MRLLTFALLAGAIFSGQAGAALARNVAACPRLGLGAETCYPAIATLRAEAQLPLAPVLPMGPVLRETGLELTRIVAIHGAGPPATTRQPVDALVFVFGRLPLTVSNGLPARWPKRPNALLVEEVVGRIFTSEIETSSALSSPPYPIWGQNQLETNFWHRNLSLAMLGNFPQLTLKAVGSAMLKLDTRVKTSLALPRCVVQRSRIHRFTISMTGILPGRAYRFTLSPDFHHKKWVRTHKPHPRMRLIKLPKPRQLGVRLGGEIGTTRLVTPIPRSRLDIGKWTLRVRRNHHSHVVRSGVVRVAANHCPRSR